MKYFLKKHCPAIVLTLIAGVILYTEYHAVPSSDRWSANSVLNEFFVMLGKWGIRFLLLSLAITPLYSLTGWRPMTRLRKPAGLIAFGFVAVHASMYVFDRNDYFGGKGLQLLFEPGFILLGVMAFIILALMAITSFKFMMRRVGRFWKPLHRLVYVAGLLIMLHSISAATYGKRAGFGGQASAHELKIYLVVLVTLLILRVPVIRDWLKRILPFAPDPRKRKRRLRDLPA